MNVLINNVSGELIGTLEGLLIAVMGYLVVYIGLTMLMILVYAIGKLFSVKMQQSASIKEESMVSGSPDISDIDDEAAIVAMMAATVLLDRDS